MGWWNARLDGASLQQQETGLVWGDGPADWMDGAIDKIVAEFDEAWGRRPTRAEMEAGLRFSLGGDWEPPTLADQAAQVESIYANVSSRLNPAERRALSDAVKALIAASVREATASRR